jgi:TPR repeat protein
MKQRNTCGANVECLSNSYKQRIAVLTQASQTPTNNSIQALNGNWYSSQWKYGYVLQNGVGTATSTNSPNFQVGQNIIRLTPIAPNKFSGQQVYTDGKFYNITATLQPDGTLYFEGEKNVKWTMARVGAVNGHRVNTPTNPVSTISTTTIEEGIKAYKNKNYEQALKIFQTLAKENNPTAQFNLGAMFADGLGVSKNLNFAFTWFKKSAENGYANAQYVIGTYYENGIAVTSDEAEALKWYRLAAQQGHKNAENRVVNIDPQMRALASKKQQCYDGCNSRQERCLDSNYQRHPSNTALYHLCVTPTEACFEKCAAISSASSATTTLTTETNGYNDALTAYRAKDYTTALHILTPLANKNDAMSQNLLGIMFANGHGVNKNIAQAVYWYKQAAENGDANAQTNLALKYKQGEGVGRDLNEAIKWFRLAAAKRQPRAQFELGLMYETGQGVAKNESEAIMWYQLAQAKGNEQAKSRLEALVQRLYAQAPPPQISNQPSPNATSSTITTPSQNPTTATHLRTGIVYEYSRTGQCQASQLRECLNADDYQKLCSMSKGMSQRAIELGATGYALGLDNDQMALMGGGTIDSSNIQWAQTIKGDFLCFAVVRLSGMVNGTSKRAIVQGVATEFALTSNRTVLVNYFSM